MLISIYCTLWLLFVILPYLQGQPVINTNTFGFDILSNFSIPVKDQHGIVHTQNVNTIQFYFNGPIGGQEIVQVLQNGNETIILDTRIEPYRYIATIQDTALSVPQIVTLYTNTIGTSQVSQSGNTPPLSLIYPGSTEFPSSSSPFGTMDTTDSPFTLMNNNNKQTPSFIDIMEYTSSSSSTMDSHQRTLKQAQLEQLTPADTGFVPGQSSSIQFPNPSTPAGPPHDYSIGSKIIKDTLARIDTARCVLNGGTQISCSSTVGTLQNQWITGNLVTCPGGQFSMGLPCSSSGFGAVTNISIFIGSGATAGINSLGNENSLVCIANMYAKWLEDTILHGADCTTWPHNVLPTISSPTGCSAMLGGQYNIACDYRRWCFTNFVHNSDVLASDFDPWIHTATVFVTSDPNLANIELDSIFPGLGLPTFTGNVWKGGINNQQVGVTLSVSSPVCSQPLSTFPALPNQVQNVNNDPTIGTLCSIDPTKYTKAYDPWNDPNFNPPLTTQDPLTNEPLTYYKYYDSPDCPCMPLRNDPNNYYYTCPDNPWNMDFPTSANQLEPYVVGILQKCSPFDNTNPASGGYCAAFLEDVNMVDYSQQQCTDENPNYPSQCPWQLAACIAAGPLCPAFGLDHCPTIQVCVQSFGIQRGNVVQQVNQFLANQANGTQTLTDKVTTLGDQAVSKGATLLTASAGLDEATLQAQALGTAIQLQENLIQINNLAINGTNQQLQSTANQLASQFNYVFAQSNQNLNACLILFSQLVSTESLFYNATAQAITSQNSTEQFNQNKLTLANSNMLIAEAAMQQAVGVMQQNVVQLPIFKQFLLDIQLTGRSILTDGLDPMMSDYNNVNQTWGQPALGTLPLMYQNLTVDSYWTYFLEWLPGSPGSTGTATNPDLTHDLVRIHQQNWVMTCDTETLFGYSNITVTIDQLRGMFSLGACWMKVTDSSCKSTMTLGALLSLLLTTNGQPSSGFSLFTFMNATGDVGHTCQSGTYVSYTNTTTSTFNFQYQVDNYISQNTCSYPNIISTLYESSNLWPGFTIYRGGKFGGLWTAGYNSSYCGVDQFSRALADAIFNPSGAGNVGAINSLATTLYSLFDSSFSITLGSAFFLSTLQAYQFGRLPRYGIEIDFYKTAPSSSTTTALGNSANAVLARLNSTIDIFNNEGSAYGRSVATLFMQNSTYLVDLLSAFQNAQLTGFSNAVSYAIIGKSKVNVPIHTMVFSDAVQPNITMRVSNPLNSTQTANLVENTIVNAQVFSQNNFVTVTSIVDENRIFNALGQQNWAQYWSCVLFSADRPGCPAPYLTTQNSESIPGNVFSYIYDIEEADVNVYARSWQQAKGTIGYWGEALGEQLTNALINETFIQTLTYNPFRNSSNINASSIPAWGKSVLAYLNYTGITVNQSIPGNTNIEDFIFDQLHNQKILATSSNADVLQLLADYTPYFASVSLNSYLVAVQCSIVVPAAPFDDYQLWDCQCMKPVADRGSKCRFFDLVYPAVPVAWVQQEPNADFWDHFYIQPRSQTIQVSFNLQSYVSEQIIATRQPCPDPSSFYVGSQNIGGLPIFIFNRPEYSSNVTLQIVMEVASTQLTNTSYSASQLQTDCLSYVSLDNNKMNSYNSVTGIWTINTTYTFPAVALQDTNKDNTAPVQIVLPGSTCQALQITMKRIDVSPVQNCYSWTTTPVLETQIPNNNIPSQVDNLIQGITYTNALTFANQLNAIQIDAASVLESFLGKVNFADVSQFASTQAIIDAFIQSSLNGNNGTFNSSGLVPTNGSIPLGKVIINPNQFGNNTLSYPNITIYGSGLPSNNTNATFDGNAFAEQYLQAWSNNASQLATLSQSLLQLIQTNAASNPGAFASAQKIAALIVSIQTSSLFITSKYENLLAYNAQQVKQLNASADITAALQNPVFATLQDAGWQCLNAWSICQTQIPGCTQATVDAIISTCNSAVLVDQDATVTSNPFSLLNGITPAARPYVWWIIYIALTLMVVYALAWYGSSKDVQEGRKGNYCLANFSNTFLCATVVAARSKHNRKHHKDDDDEDEDQENREDREEETGEHEHETHHHSGSETEGEEEETHHKHHKHHSDSEESESEHHHHKRHSDSEPEEDKPKKHKSHHKHSDSEPEEDKPKHNKSHHNHHREEEEESEEGKESHTSEKPLISHKNNNSNSNRAEGEEYIPSVEEQLAEAQLKLKYLSAKVQNSKF